MNSAHPERRQKIKHELRELLTIFLYIAKTQSSLWGTFQKIPSFSSKRELNAADPLVSRVRQIASEPRLSNWERT